MKMRPTARDLVFPHFHLYSPGSGHPIWDEISREAGRLALRIAKNLPRYKTPLDSTMFQKRKLLALLKTLKALFINKRRMAKGNQNFIPLFYIWTMTNQCNFLCSYCSNHRGGKYPELYRQGFTKNLTTRQGKALLKIMKGSCQNCLIIQQN